MIRTPILVQNNKNLSKDFPPIGVEKFLISIFNLSQTWGIVHTKNC